MIDEWLKAPGFENNISDNNQSGQIGVKIQGVTGQGYAWGLNKEGQVLLEVSGGKKIKQVYLTDTDIENICDALIKFEDELNEECKDN